MIRDNDEPRALSAGDLLRASSSTNGTTTDDTNALLAAARRIEERREQLGIRPSDTGATGSSGSSRTTRPTQSPTGAASQPPGTLSAWSADQAFIVWTREAIEEHHRRKNRPRKWQSELWFFLQRMKSFPGARDWSQAKAFDRTEAALRALNRRTAGDPWLNLLNIPRNHAQIDYMYLWPKVRRLHGDNPLPQALAEARSWSLELPVRNPENHGNDEYRSVVLIAAGLRALNGPDKPVFMPVRTAGELLGIDRNRAGTLINGVCDDGWIERANPHDFGKKRAAEYRVVVGAYGPDLAERLKPWDDRAMRQAACDELVSIGVDATWVYKRAERFAPALLHELVAVVNGRSDLRDPAAWAADVLSAENPEAFRNALENGQPERKRRGRRGAL